jgi:excisionase family DNA binding protein
MVAAACSGSREMSEPWVSVDEVSRHLGVAKDTIYRWIGTRDLPAHRVGRLWKFKLSDVDAWVERGGAGNEHRRARPTSRGGRR